MTRSKIYQVEATIFKTLLVPASTSKLQSMQDQYYMCIFVQMDPSFNALHGVAYDAHFRANCLQT